MQIIFIMMVIFSWYCSAMEPMEVSFKSRIESKMLMLVGEFAYDIKKIQIAVEESSIYFSLDNTLYIAEFDINTYELQIVGPSHLSVQYVAAADNAWAYVENKKICVGGVGESLLCESNTHRTPINGLYGITDKNDIDYFISSSTYPNFKLWYVDQSELKLRYIDQMNKRILLGVGTDQTLLYATPVGFFKRGPFAKKNNVKYVIKCARFSKKGLEKGKFVNKETWTIDEIKNQYFYYHSSSKNIYISNIGHTEVWYLSFNTDEVVHLENIPRPFIKMLFLPDRLAYLTAENLIIKNEQNEEWILALAHEKNKERILDAVIKGNRVFYLIEKKIGTKMAPEKREIYIGNKSLAESKLINL